MRNPLAAMLWLVGILAVSVALAPGLGPPQPTPTPPDQPHTSDPTACKRFCYPPGGPNTRPKGTPEGIKGYECKGDKCAKANESGDDGNCEETTGCTSHCARVCCTCLQVCI